MSLPNFIVIVADQLRVDCLPGFNPRSPVQTPHLDRLAGRGVRFSEAFTQHSVCSPSRVSFLSGRYPHVNGHRSLQYLLGQQEPNFLRSFKESGYHVVHAGARGDTFAAGAAELSLDEHGFADPALSSLADFMGKNHGQERDEMARAHYRGERPGDVVDFDEATIRTAEQWLNGAPAKPWVLYIPLIFPHPPFAVEQPWFSQYPREAVEVPRHATGPRAGFYAELARRHGWDRLTEEQWREIRGVYYGMISRLDSHVGRLLDGLQASTGADNTFVTFFSDHGEYLGDFGLVEKWPAGVDECLVRTPLIVAGPGLAGGERSDALVELIDVFPTLLDLAGVSAGHAHFGRSFSACLYDPAATHRDEAFSEGGFRIEEADLLERGPFPYDIKSQLQHDRPELVGKVVALRNREWTYVWRLYEPGELYHRPSDPHEQHNLAGQARYASLEQQLAMRVLRWLLDTADVIDTRQWERFAAVDLPRPSSPR
ncbi:sulfatase-like hydrolase/transferase [Pseudomonas sp. KFB-139]|uniref:Sulfatase-like hydrolase/transferase n=1 Tax=Pseudomonas serbiensis TaxID=3064350 RepID=A0ABT9CPK9_9PSED|nr:sulfatase-like hydrolase/transferase [Pseudomonas sp. KFB-138]MDO7925775.1 sulfatase-like hydrolase/transferase [Pseudomonas sp. KFB-138]